jgi:hypothetical protein
MKFNWGTGILIFLILFLMAAGFFIAFAMRQEVNLVHDDYYERGVDYEAQMKAEARSAALADSIQTYFENQSLVIDLSYLKTIKVDSGQVLLYRPSSRSLDLKMPLNYSSGSISIPGDQLVRGRYILKLNWYSEGLKYEVDKAVQIP